MTSPAATGITQPALSDQLAELMAQVAGYVGHRTIAIGLRSTQPIVRRVRGNNWSQGAARQRNKLRLALASAGSARAG